MKHLPPLEGSTVVKLTDHQRASLVAAAKVCILLSTLGAATACSTHAILIHLCLQDVRLPDSLEAPRQQLNPLQGLVTAPALRGSFAHKPQLSVDVLLQEGRGRCKACSMHLPTEGLDTSRGWMTTGVILPAAAAGAGAAAMAAVACIIEQCVTKWQQLARVAGQCVKIVLPMMHQ